MSTAVTQAAKAAAFQALHTDPGFFIIPNPWDAGSAKILASLGFKALATTSAGTAFVLGKPDGEGITTREDTLENLRTIASATSLPVSADMENGYGDSPEDCASAVRMAAGAGAVGCSIEDATGRKDDPIYSLESSVARIKSAVITARSLPFHFTLTARAENYLHGRPDLDDTIRRITAFAEAGADVLFAPGLKTKEEITAAVKAVAPKPINLIMGIPQMTLTIAEAQSLGVKRVSLGSAFIRSAYGGFTRAAEEVLQKGSFSFAQTATPYAELNKLFRP